MRNVCLHRRTVRTNEAHPSPLPNLYATLRTRTVAHLVDFAVQDSFLRWGHDHDSRPMMLVGVYPYRGREHPLHCAHGRRARHRGRRQPYSGRRRNTFVLQIVAGE